MIIEFCNYIKNHPECFIQIVIFFVGFLIYKKYKFKEFRIEYLHRIYREFLDIISLYLHYDAEFKNDEIYQNKLANLMKERLKPLLSNLMYNGSNDVRNFLIKHHKNLDLDNEQLFHLLRIIQLEMGQYSHIDDFRNKLAKLLIKLSKYIRPV